MKTIVISFPKAGTYLLAKVLQLAGHNPTHWHIGINSYTDYSNAPPDLAKSNPRLFDIKSPLQATIQKQAPNSFAVSHLPFNEAISNALIDVSKVVLLRNPYQCLCSQMIWELTSKRYLIRKKKFTWFNKKNSLEMLEAFYFELGTKYIKKYQGVLKWLKCENAAILTHEQLIKSDDYAIKNLMPFMSKNCNPKKIVNTALEATTLTKSKYQIDIMKYPEHVIFKDKQLKNIYDLVMSIGE